MNIYLTGYMASGKTYIGKHLAQKLDIPFIDLDARIVERHGKSIAAIFAEEGEASFRAKETETLKSISASENAIVSCGGGTFCFPKNRDWIKEQGISIYLKVSVNTLFNRLSAKEESRPIIKANNETVGELLAFIKNHLANREPDYEEADIVYEAEDAVGETVAELSTYFWRFLKS